MPTSTVEDYLKQILMLEQQGPSARASNGAIASALAVTPGSVTTMVKALADAGLVDYEAYGGVRLTASGRQLALHVVRRHRLLELFLVRVLGFQWTEVHDEAERLEHAISDRVVDRIDEVLGHPEVDPHGHPIPSSSGRVDSSTATPLHESAPGERVRVARVSDRDAGFLRTLERIGVRPGTRLTICARDAAADSVTVALGRGRHETMGLRAAARILVERSESPEAARRTPHAAPRSAARRPRRSTEVPAK
jgi:DtxR family Mn-dependent transcriptional regulator